MGNESFGTGFHFRNSENDGYFYNQSRAEQIEALKQLRCFKIVDAKEETVRQVY